MLAARRDMIDEARRIIDEARRRGVVLRLFGGLAVRDHCELAYVCERDYSDIDLIGLHKQYKQIPALFAELGFKENLHVRQATANRQLQFYRECDHPDAELHYFIHPDDHVDVFLDDFRMDHEVPLADRLEIEDYTISLSDVLLTKLQAAHMDEKDERDVISLLVPVPAGRDRRARARSTSPTSPACAPASGACTTTSSPASAHMREVLPGATTSTRSSWSARGRRWTVSRRRSSRSRSRRSGSCAPGSAPTSSGTSRSRSRRARSTGRRSAAAPSA